ncbi:MAG TPA: helix-turn-helix transcriptional regulator [Candidatus Obscuribacterales bacterium]
MARTTTSQPLLAAVGERIRKRREELALSQTEVGEITGLHRTYISDVERGRRNLSVNVLERIANALQVPIAFFFM